MFKSNIKIVIICIVVIFVFLFVVNIFIKKNSIPSKEIRLNNMSVYQGRTELNGDDVAKEIQNAMNEESIWDRLFLSDNFKTKFKNKNGIIENANIFSDFWCTEDMYNGKKNIIVLYANKKNSIFDRDESDNITSKYYFEYILNQNNEIDDLILLKKMDVYTINGEPVEE